jgi:DNA-binding XRE family transcriptional regulator
MKKRQAKSSVHNRIQMLRIGRGLSRQDLADAVGVNFQTIGYLERGEYSPSIELALKLAAHFDLPVEQVFSMTPFPPLEQTLRDASKEE